MKFKKLLSFVFWILFTVKIIAQGSGGTVSKSGIRKIHTFNSSGSLIPVVGLDSVGLSAMYYTIVGGGGGGATGSTTINGGGGGGGEVVNLNTPGVNHRSTNSITVTVGTGGAVGALGNSSSISFTTSGGTAISLTANGGNSNGSTLAFGSSRASDTATPATFGPGTSVTGGSYGYGGGAGNSAVGANGASNTGGNGGAGRSVTNAANVKTTYGGGGGGAGKNTNGNGGSGGGGAGSSTANISGTSGTANLGGGGGGATGGGSAVGGSGGSGVVIVSYEGFDYFSGASPGAWTYLNSPTNTHTSGAAVKFYTSTSLGASSWGADDIYIKSGVTLTITGSVACRNLYCDGSVVISGGSLTVNNTFFSNATQTLPNATIKNLQILGSTNTTSLSANTTLTGTLTINSGNKLNLSGFTLTVFAFSGAGTVTGSATSVLIYTGSGNTTLNMDQTGAEGNRTLKYLQLSASSQLTLGNALVIYGGSGNSGGDVELLGSGGTKSTLTTGGFLNLRYKIASDLHPIIGGLANITGSVTVEDYFVPGYRAWRQTGHVLSSAMNLSQMTDDFDLYGIKGASGTGGIGNNADNLFEATSTAKNSIFLYNEASGTSKWIPFTFTSGTPNTIPVGKGCMFFMRPTGSGASGNYNSQLMDYSGTINNADITTSSGFLTYSGGSVGSSNGYNLLSNPYCAYLNMSLFTDDNLDLVTSVYKYDKQAKNYKTYTKTGTGSGATKKFQLSGSGSDVDNFIHPGDAFWVKMNTSATNTVVNFKLTQVSTTPSGLSNKMDKTNKLEIDSQSFSNLYVNLSFLSDTLFSDGVTISNRGNGGTMDQHNLREGDALDFVSSCNELSIFGLNNEMLSLKTLTNQKNWNVPLNVVSCVNGKGVLSFDIEYNKPGMESRFTLVDKFLNKTSQLTSGYKYQFEITDDAKSKGTDRFLINIDNSQLNADNENSLKNNVLIYPNPASKSGELQISIPNIDVKFIELVDVIGKSVYKENVIGKIGIKKINLDNLKLNSGTYFLHLTGVNQKVVSRVVLF